MTKPNPHYVRTLEQSLTAAFGWKAIAEWRDKLIVEIQRKAHRLGISEDAYCQSAIASPTELQTLAELVSNNETRFFREVEQMNALRQQVIPELLERKATTRALNIWSVACSTGEEVYSVAMIVKEMLPDNWRVKLLATDLRGQAIIQATKGRYLASSLTFVEAKLRQRYFTEAEQNGREPAYEIAREVKNLVTFRRANLCDVTFWKSLQQTFDLILCNNLLLHFHPLAVKKMVARMVNTLESGGLLTVTKKEAMFIEHSELKAERSLSGAFFKKL